LAGDLFAMEWSKTATGTAGVEIVFTMQKFIHLCMMQCAKPDGPAEHAHSLEPRVAQNGEWVDNHLKHK
jgi:hypothetical protein